MTHFNYFDRKQKSTAEAIRPEDEKFFEVDMKVLIVSVSLAAMVLYAFCDIILATFESDFGKIKRTSRRQTESLIFCLLLYLVPVMALFSYRFQVKHLGARNNFGKFENFSKKDRIIHLVELNELFPEIILNTSTLIFDKRISGYPKKRIRLARI